jgi:phosphohistidine phosphatase
MAFLAQMLDNGEGDEEVAARMTTGFPTSAVTVFAFEGDWTDLDMASAALVGFHVGRG